MRLCTLLSALCVLTSSVASGQWLETTIPLPDSLQGPDYPWAVLSIPEEGKMLVSGAGPSILVFDAASGQKCAVIPLDERVPKMCYCPAENKVYCGELEGERIWVVDMGSLRVTDTVYVCDNENDDYLNAISYAPSVNRLFCAVGGDTARLVVIDCPADTVLASVPFGEGAAEVCSNLTGDTVYAVADELGDVIPFDALTLDPIDSIWSGSGSFTLLFDHISNKVYCANAGDGDISAIDAQTNRLIRYIPVDFGVYELSLNTRHNTIYAAGRNALAAISGWGDSVLSLPAVGSYPSALVYDSLDDRLYCANSGSDNIAIIDGASNGTIGWIDVREGPADAALNPVRNEVVVACLDADAVVVVDCSINLVVATYWTWFVPGRACVSRTSNKLYCCGQSGKGPVAVIDCATNRVVQFITTPVRAEVPVWNSATNRVYCSGRDYGDTTFAIIDCASDSLIRTVVLPDAFLPPLFCPQENKLYCPLDHRDSVAVLDCDSDSMVAVIGVWQTPSGLAYDPADNRVYCLGGNPTLVSVIDCATDSVVAFICPGTWLGSPTYLSIPNQLACALPGDNGVLVIDCATNRIVDTIVLGRSLLRMLYSQVSNKLFAVTGMSGDSIAVIDCDSLRLRRLLRGGHDVVGLAHDTIADRVYCAVYFDSSVAVVDGTADSLLCSIRLPRRPGWLAWSPAQRRMYVTHERGSIVSVIRDTAAVGIAGSEPGAVAARPSATIIRGILVPSRELSGDSRQPVTLLDAAGRKVMELRPGANDVRHLAAGVYFIRPAGTVPHGQGTVPIRAKVVIQR